MPRGDYWKHWTERLKDGVLLNPETGCIEWQRSKNNRGYGIIYLEGKHHLAHRAAWYAQHGEWPDPEKVTDHICNNKGCINVDHLRELPNHLNLRRAIPRGNAETERRRARQRKADAKRRGNYRYTEAGT
ncbi:endonuclease [Arthrobacter phage Sarge]|uniref:HNH endonuclease n=1 Tax=Arthrobacter phage Sarge TaxID=2885974 RepID=A0AAE8Y5F2_9CAUD|nr:endonuclease [Arthrobacter phage Sarge]UDL14902.1 HNH endonuclease [Arthrobacter phage Sarge]